MCRNSVRDMYRFPLCSNKLKTAGGSEKEINGKNLLLIAMMKKLEAFVEALEGCDYMRIYALNLKK